MCSREARPKRRGNPLYSRFLFTAITSCIVSFVSAAAVASGLADTPSNSSIAAVRSHPTDTARFAVYAVSSGGDIVSSEDNSSDNSTGEKTWLNHGKAVNSSPATGGVAAISYVSGSNSQQVVYYVGQDTTNHKGTLYEGTRSLTGSNTPLLSWSAISLGSNDDFVGYIAAGTFTSGGSRYTAVLVKDRSGSTLHLLVRNMTGGGATWYDVTSSTSWDNINSFAATTNASESIVSFFAIHSTRSKIGMIRFTAGTGWSFTNLGAPAGMGGAGVGSVAAAQAQLDASTYRLSAFCTGKNGSSKLYVAEATSESSTTFTWTTQTLPYTTGDVNVTGNIVGATAHANGSGGKNIDAWVIAFNKANLMVATRSASGFATIADLGASTDAAAIQGGIQAVPMGQNSRLFLLGRYTAQLGGSDELFYLYERNSYGGSGTSWSFRADGAGDRRKTVVASGTRAEGGLAHWSNMQAVCVMDRPGSGASDWPRIHSFFSSDDGDSWGSVVVHPNVVDSTTYNYVADPSCAVTDTGRVYTLMLGVNPLQSGTPSCQPNPTSYGATAIWMNYTDNSGGTLSSPIVLATGTGLVFDHPFLAIQHVPAGADRLHIAWAEIGVGVRYAYYDDGVGLSTPVTLTAANVGVPLISANDLGDVYVWGELGAVCKLNSSFTGCLGGAFDTNVNAYDNWPPVTAGTTVIRTGSFSGAASQTESGIVYGCYQKDEGSDSPVDADTVHESDIYCRRAAFDPLTNTFTWASEHLANLQAQDGRDQFGPSVRVTKEDDGWTSAGSVVVTWYDRSDSSTNYSYRVRQAISTDNGQTFPYVTTLYAVDSDPDLLPRACLNTSHRFIGDYSETNGSDVHSHTFYITVPGGSVGTSVRESFQALGAGQ